MPKFERGNKNGRFTPGVSGNPSGRPKIVAEIQELARQHTPSAIKALVQIVEDEKASPSARVAAAAHILDRAYGKPPQAVEHTGNSVLQVITGILRSPDEPLQLEASEPGEGSLH
jgi:hypothetical protein